jgi:hypothetical protein
MSPRLWVLLLYSSVSIEIIKLISDRNLTDKDLPLTLQDHCNHLNSEIQETLKTDGEFLPYQKFFTVMLEEGRYNLQVPEDVPFSL